MTYCDSLNEISDSRLLKELEDLSRRETEATVEILLHLAEVEKRKLFLQEGSRRQADAAHSTEDERRGASARPRALHFCKRKRHAL